MNAPPRQALHDLVVSEDMEEAQVEAFPSAKPGVPIEGWAIVVLVCLAVINAVWLVFELTRGAS